MQHSSGSTSQYWATVEEIFHRALTLEGHDRDAYLATSCRENEKLRADVQRLLDADNQGDEFLDTPIVRAADGPDVGPVTATASPGDRAGSYQLTRHLGSGGMGEVWLAQRADGVFSKDVAIKLLRRDLDSGDFRARFESERQLLAMLDHTNIARLLDGGTTDSGRPFLVMEYADGKPLTEFCGEQGLSITQKIALFLDVCAAVQYAHHLLIIHRDLKPENIMVNADGEVKLLDFGIAKLLAEEGNRPAADITAIQRPILTPRYASPEQVRGDVLSTATDVYSLGIVLYQLLTGRLPYNVDAGSASQMERSICDTEPTKPSQAVLLEDDKSGPSAGDGTSDRLRLSEPDRKKLQRALRGELDLIILKSLRKDPARRYQSVEQFSEDIRNYLTGMPVLARPESVTYRARKFVARNRVGVVATSLLLVVSIVGFAVSTTLFLQSRAARRAEQNERRVSQDVSRFLETMLASVNPRESQGEDVKLLRRLVDESARRIEQDLGDQPAAQAILQHVLGETYLSLGQTDVAEPLMTESYAKLQSVYGDRHPRTMWAARNVAVLWRDQSRIEEAHALLVRTHELQVEVLGPSHRDTMETLDTLGISLISKGNLSQAESVLKEAVQRRQAVLGKQHFDTLVSMNNLSNVYHRQGKYLAAETLLRDVIDMQSKVLLPSHPDLLVSKSDLASAFRYQNKLLQAETLFRELLPAFRNTFGDDHMDTLIVWNNLAGVLVLQERYEESANTAGQLVAVAQKSLPEGSHYTAVFRGGFGTTLASCGRNDEARRELQAAVDSLTVTLGADHRHTRRYVSSLAELDKKQNAGAKAKQTISAASDEADQN